MKKTLLMAIVASSLFACNKQETTDTEKETGGNAVTISITQAALTKGVTNQIGASEYAIIGSGKIYFIDASNISIHQRELTATEITTLANTATTAGGNSITITGIPSEAVRLYFMANIKTAAGASFPMVDGTTSADARLRVDKLQADVTHVPMSGVSSVFTLVSGANYTTSVELTPIVARVELGQITAENANGAGQAAISTDITGYKLSGVFINYTRENVLLNGTPYLVGAPMDIRNQAGWATDWATYFTTANTKFPYYNGGNPSAPADWTDNALVTYCAPTSAGLSFYPEAAPLGATTTDPSVTPKRAWGYQVCPSTTPQPGATDVPHIILKLTEVKYNDNPLGSTTLYVTVTKYKDATNTAVTEFKRGNVYRIQNLIFTHNEATDQPYEKNITVTATVSVIPWIINELTPDWSAN